MTGYIVKLIDHDPKFGGVTEVFRPGTRKEAVWYAEREVNAAKELGFTAQITFTVQKVNA